MNTASKLEQLKTLLGFSKDYEEENELLLTLLTLASGKILERLYPYDKEKQEIPERYVGKQLEIAVYLYNKRGAEGQISHGENGINRTYESSDVPESLMRGIAPFVGVVR